jgi:glycosyltransferase involved in cell wall biosynthesis
MIQIFSIHYNKPEYLELQIESFKKFINIDYEFIVIDNSIDESISLNLKKICDNNQIKYLFTDNKTPHGSSTYGWSHLNGLNFFKKYLIESDYKNIILIEHDIFLCSNIEKMYELSLNNSICGYFQDRGDINYLHPGLLFFNKDLCFDLHTIDFGGVVI